MKIGLKGTVAAGGVKEIWCGGTRFREVWAEGEQYYSDSVAKVSRFVLSDPVEASYWTHVVHAVQELMPGLLAELEFNGQRFHLGAGDGSLPVIRYSDGWWQVDGSAELLVSSFLGGEVVVRAAVPESMVVFPAMVSGWKEGSSEVAEIRPPLDGTRYRCSVVCGGSTLAFCLFQVSVQPASAEDFLLLSNRAWVRASYTVDVPAVPEIDKFAAVRLEILACNNGTTRINGAMMYPAFEKEFRMRVINVMTM